ncbi:magnesium/cobalt transporter CorA [Methylomicrobium sp. Wu6]|uniref:magnesium/cobalt transporter CorA n=1 Tax=Methylomicrobium sp. Wu6 TaxID=3107928 RepID=UPI002DD68167|nr:magnesium/cobalt transporter CorA [Methylomicrobium sp. Wu6]MEC4750092.1 magnesium/cobalt transporter CorA [Methylomicrobium sp. Wu6]
MENPQLNFVFPETSINPSMVMNCIAYKHGKRLGTITLEAISDVLAEDGTFVWLGLREADKALLAKIQKEFDLHELAIEDACSAHQRPKLEEYGDSLFLVLQTAQLTEDSGVAFGETHLFVGARFLVSVRHSSSLSYAKVRERCEHMPEQLNKGPGFALYALMDFIVDHYLPVVQGLEQRLDQLESDIFDKDFRNETFAQLYELKRDLLLLRGATLPWLDICSELMRFHTHIIPKDTRFYFRDVHDHAQRIHQAVEGMREMLNDAMQVHLTMATVRQNEVVKRLAGWGAILAVPTMVFSLYGMNFKHMPELDWRYAYPATLGIVIVGCIWLHRRLKSIGWL